MVTVFVVVICSVVLLLKLYCCIVGLVEHSPLQHLRGQAASDHQEEGKGHRTDQDQQQQQTVHGVRIWTSRGRHYKTSKKLSFSHILPHAFVTFWPSEGGEKMDSMLRLHLWRSSL